MEGPRCLAESIVGLTVFVSVAFTYTLATCLSKSVL